MPKLRQVKTSFTAGEIDPRLRGRVDHRVYENGASRLRNVWVFPLGGVMRRWGMRFLADMPKHARLLAFEFNTEQLYLLALMDGEMRVFIEGDLQTTVATPYTAAQVPQVYVTQSADTLLLTHPDVTPQKITRTSHIAWTIAPWAWFVDENDVIQQPYYKHAAEDITMHASATTGKFNLVCSQNYFKDSMTGMRLRVANKEVLIESVTDALNATVTARETLVNTVPTRDWAEPAFSNQRGWPVTTCFHQSRLVIGGARDLPNRLWLSQSGDLWNFGLGTGNDGEAIETPLLSDQVNAIRGVFSGPHLQVYTSGAEWAVFGEPLTPAKIDIRRQTRIGTPVTRLIPPVSVDGATVFVPRQGAGLRGFTYSDVQQAYEAPDLALTANHLFFDVAEMAYDPANRWLHVINAAGNLSTLTIYRSEEVTAPSRIETDGAVRSIAVVGDQTFMLLERNTGIFTLEVFDPSCSTDAALQGSAETAKITWAGLDHLEGRQVRVVADGADAGTAAVVNGAVTLADPAKSVEVGLSFSHVVEALPPAMTEAPEQVTGKRWRLMALTVLLHETRSLRLDLGAGTRVVPLRGLGDGLLDAPPPPFSGEVLVRALGWRRGANTPWRIEDDTPVAFTLLSVTAEIMVNH